MFCVCDFHIPGLGVGGEIESEVLVELKTAILSSHVCGSSQIQRFSRGLWASNPSIHELWCIQTCSRYIMINYTSTGKKKHWSVIIKTEHGNMAELHHCPLGSVSCSQVHSVVAGHFGTKPVSTKGCWCWKSLSKSSKEKLLKSTSTQNVLSKSFKDVSSSEMTSFPPPTWAMWTTSWSEMIWIPIWSQQDQSHVSCCTVETSKKHRPLGLSSAADSHLQRQITKKFSGCTSIHHRCPLVLLVSCFLLISVALPTATTSWLYQCVVEQSSITLVIKAWGQLKHTLTDLHLKTARALEKPACHLKFFSKSFAPSHMCFCPGGSFMVKEMLAVTMSSGMEPLQDVLLHLFPWLPCRVVCWATKCLGQNHQQHDFGTALHCNHWSSTRKPLIEESQRMPMSNTRLSWSHHREFCCLRSRFNLLWDTRKKHASRMPKWMHASNPLEFFVKRVLSHDTLPILLPQVQP